MSEQRDLEAAVLRLVLDVGSFTIPQLVSLTGIGHEIVARTLEAALGDGIKRTDEVTAGGLAAPARIWVVDDPRALEARLSDRGRPAARAAAFAPCPEAERELAAAEDAVVIALQARRPEHAAEFADQAAAALRRSGIAPTGDERLPLGAKRNLKPVDARACSVAALSTYLRSREAEGLSGPLWRQAFSTVAAVDLPEEGAFQKRLLADLVRVADERAVARFAEAAAGDGEQLVRSAHEAYGSTTEVPEALVDGLRRLATGEDRLLAERARQALIAIAQPRDESFWRALAGAAHPAPQQVVFRGLSRFDLKAAFAYLLEQITTDEAGIAAAVTTLQACLPALADEAPVLAEDRFAALLASLTADDRAVLMAAPVLAGLSWPRRRSSARSAAGCWPRSPAGAHCSAAGTAMPASGARSRHWVARSACSARRRSRIWARWSDATRSSSCWTGSPTKRARTSRSRCSWASAAPPTWRGPWPSVIPPAKVRPAGICRPARPSGWAPSSATCCWASSTPPSSRTPGFSTRSRTTPRSRIASSPS